MIYNYDYNGLYVIGELLTFIAFFIVIGAQIMVNSNYSKYKKIRCNNGITGKDVARKILDNNGLSNIDIVEVSGNLTDHYDPKDKVIRLSHDIYSGNSVASVAVAAHECGHAIQDLDGYKFMRIRSAIVPTVNLCSRLGYIVIFLGCILGYFNLAIFGLILLGAMLLFQLVTLPVEFDASNRAKKQIKKMNLIEDREQEGIKKMLMAAAMTYVASVISTLLELFRMFLIIISRNDRD